MQDNPIHLHGLSAVFCLSGSPFQAMCMIEAINTFEITDYKVLLCLSKSELPRQKQLEELLKKYGIKYRIESIDFHITKEERIKAMLPRYSRYKLVFIGDCNNELLIFKAFRYVSNGGTLIYLDDGIATIQFYNGLCQLDNKLRKYYNLLCKVRNIDFDKYFFTIYNDLDDGKHISIANRFNYLATNHSGEKRTRNVVVLGTCTDDFCRMERINPSVFLDEQNKLLKELKNRYPDDRIVFVPHGRDVYMSVKKSCEELGITYMPTSISVEMYLLDADYMPKAVYGFTSSALYNLNLLLPDSEIVNVTFSGNTPQNDRIDITSRYYAKHGIKRIIQDLKQ